ncbi:MAG TPA: acyl-CoA dehydrogenase [Mycobacteriales bacterium]|nr:acyl-CoA dehydrogenase [Mycobacteriales bacterium]
MSIAITDTHRLLAETASDFLRKHESRAAARTLLETDSDGPPSFWGELASLGWLGLHVDESDGGLGYGLEELVIVVEELGRAIAPGPFVPTVIASAVLQRCADADTKRQFLAGLADGTKTAAIVLAGAIERDGVRASADGLAALGDATCDFLVIAAGDDVLVIDSSGTGVSIETPPNFDPTRRASRTSLDRAPATVIAGAGQTMTDLARLILSAEAVGVARECTTQASEYAKVREQFGRPIAMFQAVKHHCANMLVATELATAAVWDAARAAASGGDQLSYAAAVAATLAAEAGYLCANLNIQVHGGIGMTWEHDAHLYLRRATALQILLNPDAVAAACADHVRNGVRRIRSVDLPPEAEALRLDVREFASSVSSLDRADQLAALIKTGYVMPHWPKPWGRDAGAVEQLVIEQEFADAGLKRPSYAITGWVILTLIQHASAEQVDRWVSPALNQDVIWCQLFSEPDAGSDAAGVRTSAVRTEGGWIVNGQKVWTSGAHLAGFGLATIRTNTTVEKHRGITTMVIDMKSPGVQVRPLRMTTGQSDFNEVFFDDVFVPDDDVVGPIDGGWTIARATLGNESVSIGGGEGLSTPAFEFIRPLSAHPERLAGGAARVGRYAARHEGMMLLNLRSASRALAGSGPGPEGNVTKLVLSELSQDAAAIFTELGGSESLFVDGDGAISGIMVLLNRALSIAGGTSEIKRNQIGERILGLPRDPLIS